MVQNQLQDVGWPQVAMHSQCIATFSSCYLTALTANSVLDDISKLYFCTPSTHSFVPFLYYNLPTHTG